MPYVQSDGAWLYYEEAGSGTPIVFVHEFSGDLWSWQKADPAFQPALSMHRI
jgi:pimeloyl-ACP methyl ester carboxylesterase